MEELYFDYLPQELLLIIGDHLDDKSLVNLREISNRAFYWSESIVKNRYPQYYTRITRAIKALGYSKKYWDELESIDSRSVRLKFTKRINIDLGISQFRYLDYTLEQIINEYKISTELIYLNYTLKVIIFVNLFYDVLITESYRNLLTRIKPDGKQTENILDIFDDKKYLNVILAYRDTNITILLVLIDYKPNLSLTDILNNISVFDYKSNFWVYLVTNTEILNFILFHSNPINNKSIEKIEGMLYLASPGRISAENFLNIFRLIQSSPYKYIFGESLKSDMQLLLRCLQIYNDKNYWAKYLADEFRLSNLTFTLKVMDMVSHIYPNTNYEEYLPIVQIDLLIDIMDSPNVEAFKWMQSSGWRYFPGSHPEVEHRINFHLKDTLSPYFIADGFMLMKKEYLDYMRKEVFLRDDAYRDINIGRYIIMAIELSDLELLKWVQSNNYRYNYNNPDTHALLGPYLQILTPGMLNFLREDGFPFTRDQIFDLFTVREIEGGIRVPEIENVEMEKSEDYMDFDDDQDVEYYYGNDDDLIED